MVPNNLFSKYFQVVCLFWISETLMDDTILASNYCQVCTSLFPEDLARGWIMYLVHLQHNYKAEHRACIALLCSLPQFRHSHLSYSGRSSSFTVFPTVRFPPKNLPHKHSYSCSPTNASACGRAGIFGTRTFGPSLQCLLCSLEYICT